MAIYRRLARERLELDDPSAEFDLHREFWGGGQRDFEFALLSVRAGASEQGRDSLDALRGLHDEAPTGGDKRDVAAALVDALVLYGCWAEAVRIADTVALRRLDSAQKRMLLMDRCDAVGELGIDIEGDWDRVVRSARDHGIWARRCSAARSLTCVPGASSSTGVLRAGRWWTSPLTPSSGASHCAYPKRRAPLEVQAHVQRP